MNQAIIAILVAADVCLGTLVVMAWLWVRAKDRSR
jgi:hypothetical protein